MRAAPAGVCCCHGAAILAAHDPPMQSSRSTPSHSRDDLAAFLAEHVGTPWRDDVGPWIGQASFLRATGIPDAETLGLWNAAVTAAVSTEAVRAQDRTVS
jgi:hypothetical protein